jgi:hypothetical protein
MPREKAEKIVCFSTVLEVLMNGPGNKKENCARGGYFLTSYCCFS